MELIDIVDERDNPVGEPVEKDIAHKQGKLHRVSHVWIVTPDGRLICQKRSETKTVLPNKWDTIHGGHVKSGSNYIRTAIEELNEEIGLKVDAEDLIDMGKYKLKNVIGDVINNEFCQAFMLIYKGDIKDLRIDNDEVSEIKLFNINEIEAIMSDSVKKMEFVPGIIDSYMHLALPRIKERLTQTRD